MRTELGSLVIVTLDGTLPEATVRWEVREKCREGEEESKKDRPDILAMHKTCRRLVVGF